MSDQLISKTFNIATKYGLNDISVTRLTSGRINDTFRLDTPKESFILQRLNEFFCGDEALGENWLAAYQKLAAGLGQKNLPMPQIFPTSDGELLARDSGGSAWRLTSYIKGCPAPLNTDAACHAGRLLGTLHASLNLPAPFPLKPLPAGEFTNQHLSTTSDFEDLFQIYRGHPKISDLTELILTAMGQAANLPFCNPDFAAIFPQKDVIIHGDPKAANFLFTTAGEVLALLDWDTVSYGHLLVDLVELARSWGTETKSSEPSINIETLVAPLQGYAETGLSLAPLDLELFPPLLRAVVLNLARRYLIDAFAEVYFQWDAENYPSLAEQNRERCEKLLALGEILINNEMIILKAAIAAYNEGLAGKIIAI